MQNYVKEFSEGARELLSKFWLLSPVDITRCQLTTASTTTITTVYYLHTLAS